VKRYNEELAKRASQENVVAPAAGHEIVLVELASGHNSPPQGPGALFRRRGERVNSVESRCGKRKQPASDQELVQRIADQVRQRGLTPVAKKLGYDVANLSKLLVGKPTHAGDRPNGVGCLQVRGRRWASAGEATEKTCDA